ncbi:MAG: hypothetical protein ABUR63_01835 [Verrucomicrobiota bacterium]
MSRFYVSVLGIAIVTLSSACSFQEKAGTGGTNPSNYDGSAGVDRNFVMGETGAVTGDACPQNSFNANNLPPDLLILLDRSGSMNEDSTGTNNPGPMSKWTQVTGAINQVAMSTETMVNWGLKFFGTGSGQGCAVAAGAAVPPNTMTAAAIATAIAAPANQPATSTPTRAAVTSAGAYLAGLTARPNPKYILLATDGQPNCAQGGGNSAVDDPAAIAAVGSVAAMGFPTFVIGIATNGVAEATLNSMATMGGRPRTGMPQLYYPVQNGADLQMALTQIQAMVALPCQFQLGGAPTNLGAVTVSVGGNVVPMSDWTYGPGNRSVIFPENGQTCMNLKSGAVKNVLINLPCGEAIIP